MSRSLTPDESEQRRLLAMGVELGQQYHLLWNEVVWVHMKWQEFEKLYAHSAERIEFLNRVASTFFWQLQDTMWRDVLLHIARLVDQPESRGKKNLTIQGLPGLVPDQALRQEAQRLADDAVSRCQFAKDRRNRHIAHSDLALKLKQAVHPLAQARRIDVSEGLAAIARVLNRLELAYTGSTTEFSRIPLAGGAEALVAYLELGLAAEQERRQRWRAEPS